MSRKAKIALKVALALPGAFLMIPMGWGVLHVAWGGPISVGNTPENVAKLADASDGKFTFAVMGDREDGHEVFKRLARRAQEDGCRFMVILGDVVHLGVDRHFRYFRFGLGESGFTGPVFSVVGNHDVVYDDHSAFERCFGPGRFSFVYGGCLFLFMDNAYAMSPEQIAWADGLLTRLRPTVRHAFLMMHRPPALDRYDGWSPIQDLLKRHAITRIYAGHSHTFRREEGGGTAMIVTGGAGGKPDAPRYPYHYTQVDIDGDALSERTVTVPDPTGWEKALTFLKKSLIMNGFCYVQDHPWLFAPIGAAIVTTLMLAGQGARALARRQAPKV